MLIPDPGSWFLPIPDPGSREQKRGVKKICCHNFLCSHKFHKIATYFGFEVLKKKIWASLQRIIELFTQKIVTKLSKIWVWDPGSWKIYSGSRGQKGTGSRIRNTGVGVDSGVDIRWGYSQLQHKVPYTMFFFGFGLCRQKEIKKVNTSSSHVV